MRGEDNVRPTKDAAGFHEPVVFHEPIMPFNYNDHWYDFDISDREIHHDVQAYVNSLLAKHL